jgi:polyisoprenyl-phosphate glycosyltransferase
MMRLMDEGADVVYGRRISREGESLFKKLSAQLFYRLLSRLSDTEIPQDAGDFRLMRRRIVDVIGAMPEQQRFIRGMVSWVGGVQVPLDYARRPRLAGETKYPFLKMVRFAADAITSFSVKPLRTAIWMAMTFGVVALMLLAYSLMRWFDEGTVPGWTSLMTALCIFSSLQFLLIGIIGEYVGRIFLEMKRRPLFLVDRIIADGGTTVRPPMEWSTLPPAERHKVLEELRVTLQPGAPDLDKAAGN